MNGQNVFPHAKWRLIQDTLGDGAWNMAVDEALLEAVSEGISPPVLRLYAWNPPCLSLGYAQPIMDVDLESIERNGWQVVRRPTGGRAILHTDELTYSVIAPVREPRMTGGVLESYQRLAQALLSALHQLGVPARSNGEYSIPVGADPKGAICFEIPSNWEITVDGKKLIGSAQVRRRKGVLQHGSLPLYGDLTRITQVLVFPDEPQREYAARRLVQRAITVKRALGRRLNWNEVARTFRLAFEETLNLEFEPMALIPSEISRAKELVEQKYGDSKWNHRI